ncbi:Zinc finger CCCH domain-containing protein 22 [Linum grandiflorum]
MDSYEATKTVFSRIQGLDPENSSKIMGYLLLQDQGDKEMIRLAFGPESSLHNLILQAKTQLGLPISPSSSSTSSTSSASVSNNNSNTPSTPSTPSSPSPFLSSRPNPLSLSRISYEKLQQSNNNPSSPSSLSCLSYANVVNGGSHNNNSSSISNNNNHGFLNGNGNDLSVDEYQVHRDHFSFLNDTNNNADQVFDQMPDSALLSPNGVGHDDFSAHFHRRSYSVPGMCYGSSPLAAEDAAAAAVGGGFGWKPCLYFAKGFCKNGETCKFLHGGDSAADGGAAASSSFPEEFLMRSKSAIQQKLAAAAAASQQFTGGSVASNLAYNKCINLLLQQQSDSAAQRSAALMMGDELHKLSRCRSERSTDFSPLGLGGGIMSPIARQIYLTFPADSTFREEDVSNYFSIYGPVQDVRIPYQQKRMFGFVTFVYPETVKLILAKGNPHFVCDSRVLVKPYKEKGKIPEKKQMERGEFSPSACSSPRGLDSREPFDLNLGARMFYNTQEMLLRKKLGEQADLQQAIELHGRRLMSLQLLDLKNQHRQHLLHGLSNGSPVSSPTALSRTFSNPVRVNIDHEIFSMPEENGGCLQDGSVNAVIAGGVGQELNPSACNVQVNGIGNGNIFSENDEKYFTEQNDLQESLEHILPENLFNSPKKAAGEHLKTAFSTAALEVHEIPTTNNNSMTPLKSCFPQMPRLSSGHGTIGM